MDESSGLGKRLVATGVLTLAGLLSPFAGQPDSYFSERLDQVLPVPRRGEAAEVESHQSLRRLRDDLQASGVNPDDAAKVLDSLARLQDLLGEPGTEEAYGLLDDIAKLLANKSLRGTAAKLMEALEEIFKRRAEDEANR